MGILAHLDISRGVARAREQVIQQDNALGATAKGFANLVNAFVFFILAYLFDFDSTYDYFKVPMLALVSHTQQPWWVVNALPIFMFALSLTNTLIELFAPDLGEKIGMISFLVFLTLCFDAWTDYPRVQFFLVFFRPDGGSIIEWGIWYVCHPLLLAFATFVFEFCAVIFATTSLFSFVWAWRLALIASFRRQHAQQ